MKQNVKHHSISLGLCAALCAATAVWAQEEALQDIHYAERDTSNIRGATSASATDLSLWDSAKFQKEFLGSYGMNADIEPSLTAVEYEQMQKILEAMSEEDDQEKAIKLLKKNCGEASSAIFEFTLANLYFQEEQFDEALALYDQAVDQFPTFRRAYKNAALIHVRNSDFKKALPFLTKTLELGENSSTTYGLLGFAYASEENNLCAESAYRQAILLDPETVDWQMGLAQSLFKQRKYGDAVSLCDSLIRRDPQNAGFWLLQANAYLGLKQPVRAAENYEYVNTLGESTPESMTMLGDIYVNESRWDMAADAYLRAFELDQGEHPDALLRASGILAARGALGEAKRTLERVADRKAALSEVNLKSLLKLQARVAVAEGADDESVVAVLEEAIKVDPLDGEALILLGRHYGRENPAKAINCYEMAAGIDGFEAEAKLYHGQLLVGMSKYAEAVKLLRSAYELKPREDVAEYLKQVESLAKAQG